MLCSIRNLRRISAIAVLIAAGMPAGAQFFDSLSIRVGTVGTAASKDYQPFWSTANKNGVISDSAVDASSFISIRNRHTLKTWYQADSTKVPKSLWAEYAFEGYNNGHGKEWFVGQGYLKLNYKNWQLRAGRFSESIGGVDPNLSTGSLGISTNALPVPRVGFAVVNYTDLPFTNGWVQFKGTFSHGWMGSDRYLTSYLHEKSFYLRILKKKLKLYGGLQHVGEWGGHRPGITLDRDINAFIAVLFVQESRDGGGLPSFIRPGRAGDQRGLIEAGFEWENDKILLNGYNQSPFETGIGIDIRNIDRLAGLSITFKKPESIIKKVLVEYIYTKQMEIYGREVHSYYNNGFYKTGWEYKDRVVGTPLMINRIRSSYYFPGQYAPFDWDAPANTLPGNSNIISNRLSGAHLGVISQLSRSISGKTMFTYTRNYGSYKVTPYQPVSVQFYTMQQFAIKPRGSRFDINLAVALDFGDLTDNVGGVAGVTYRIL